MTSLPDKRAEFQSTILEYWDQYGRKALPWRLTKNPWQILVAEILLRKTTSQQAVNVFHQLREFSPSDIAVMDIATLEEILRPLGLYRVRALGLKAIASTIVDVGEEQLQSSEFVRSLPGVGRYIANMVCACAFGEPTPGLDTNMIRVLQRVFGWVSKRKRPREDKQFWEFAETLVPDDRPCEFNWGVFDLGAEICTHYNPKCSICPLNNICSFYQSGLAVIE